MPEISVGIPTYNPDLKYLRECLESVKKQTHQPDQIIILDDGSSNKEEIQKMAEEFKAKYYRNDENLGIGATRKRIVELCDSDLLFFISADDSLLPNALEASLSYAEAYPDTIFYSDFNIIDENGNKTGESRSPEFSDYKQFTQAVLDSAHNNRMFTCWNMLSPTEIQRKVGYDENLRFGEDLDFLLRSILISNIKFVHIPWILFKYRTHKNMVTQKKWSEIATNNRKIFDKINSLLGQKIL